MGTARAATLKAVFVLALKRLKQLGTPMSLPIPNFAGGELPISRPKRAPDAYGSSCQTSEAPDDWADLRPLNALERI